MMPIHANFVIVATLNQMRDKLGIIHMPI